MNSACLLNLDTRQVPIVVRLPEEAKNNVSQLADLYVPTSGNTGARVGEVFLSFGTGPSEILRFDRERAITINVQVADGELGGNWLKR